MSGASVPGPWTDPCVPPQVRRGSEPALNQLCPVPQFPAPASRADASKRWSAAPIIDDEQQIGAAKRKVRAVRGRDGLGVRGGRRADHIWTVIVITQSLRIMIFLTVC